MAADGSIIIDTGIDTSGIKADSKDLQSAAKAAAESVSSIGDVANNAFKQVTGGAAEATQSCVQEKKEVETLEKALNELSKQGVDAEDFEEIKDYIEDDITSLKRLFALRDDYISGGGSENDPAMQYQIEKINELMNSIREARNEIDDITSGALSKMAAESSQEIVQAAEKLEAAEKEVKKAANDASNIRIHHMESDDKADDLDEPRVEYISRDDGGLAKSAQAYMDNLGKSAEETDQKVQTLISLIQQAKKELKDLEKQGIGPGDSEYDSRKNALASLVYMLNQYNKAASAIGKADATAGNTIEGQIAQAKAELAQMESEGKGIEDADYSATVSELSELTKKYKEMYAAAQNSGKIDLSDIAKQADVADQHVANLARELAQLKARQAQLSKAGVGLGYAEYDSNARKILEINKELNQYQSTVSGASRKTSSFGSNLGKVGTAASTLAKRLGSSLSSGIKRATSAMASLARSFRTSSSAANGLDMSLGAVIKTTLLYGTVSQALSLASSGMSTGIQNLAQYSSSVNASVSSMMSALTQLKNSFASAFAPILTVVAPIVTKFCNMLSKAITYVGMFIAALTGQSTYTKAVPVQEDYAASLNDTSDAAKDAAKSTKKAAKENKTYLSGLDEIRQYTSDNDSDSSSSTPSSGSGSSGSSGGGTVSPSDMFEEAPILSSIKGIADKIRSLIEAEDWDGLGEYLASGINKGLQMIYDLINWDNVGPKITEFCDAFCTTFNSLVDNIDWDLLGRTIGAGINTLVNTINLLLTGIDWENLGKKIAEGFNGLFDEINWTNLGNTLGTAFMVPFRMLNGFLKKFEWDKLGKDIADLVNGLFDPKHGINFTEVGSVLAKSFNGVFEALGTAAKEIHWSEIADNISNGLNTFIHGVHWAENGKNLSNFVTSLLGTFKDVAEDTDWEGLGKGIGDFLDAIDWGTILGDVATIIWEVSSGLISGLLDSNSGKIVLAIGTAIEGIKLANFFTKLFTGANLAQTIFTAVTGSSGVTVATETALNTGFSGMFNGSVLTTITSGAKTLVSGLGSVLGTIGSVLFSPTGIIIAGIAIGVALIIANWDEISEAAGKVGKWVGEKFSDMKEAVSDACSKLGKGVKDAWDTMSKNVSDKAKEIKDAASEKWEGIKSDASTKWSEVQTNLSTTWENLKTDASTKFENIKSTVSTKWEETKTAASTKWTEIKTELGTAWENIKTDAGTKFDNIKSTVSDAWSNVKSDSIAKWKEVKDDVTTKWDSMSSSASKKFEGIKKTVSDKWDSVKSNSSSVWESVKSTASSKWGNIKDTVTDAAKKIKDNVSDAIGKLPGKFKDAAKDAGKKMKEKFEDFDWKKVGSNILDGIKNGLDAASSALYNKMWDIASDALGAVKSALGIASPSRVFRDEVGKMIPAGITVGINKAFPDTVKNLRKETGRLSNVGVNIPVATSAKVPYLASGAVIPPNKAFMAVLGDQKQGTNVEAPLETIKQAVAEVLTSNNNANTSSGGTYKFVGQINRRTLFEEMMTEAQLVRSQSGRNPFEMA